MSILALAAESWFVVIVLATLGFLGVPLSLRMWRDRERAVSEPTMLLMMGLPVVIALVGGAWLLFVAGGSEDR